MINSPSPRAEVLEYEQASTIVLRLAGQIDPLDIGSWLAPAIKQGAAKQWKRLLIDFRLADLRNANPLHAVALGATLSALNAPRHWRYATLHSIDCQASAQFCLAAASAMNEQRWHARTHNSAHEAWFWTTEGEGGLRAAVDLARQPVTQWGRGASAEWHIQFHRPDCYPSFIHTVVSGVMTLEDQLHLIEQVAFAQAKTYCHLHLLDYRQSLVVLTSEAIGFKMAYLRDLAMQSGLDLDRRRSALLHNPNDSYMQRLTSFTAEDKPAHQRVGAVGSFNRPDLAADWLLGKGGYMHAMRQYDPLPASHRFDNAEVVT